MAKLVYHLMSDKELRKRVAEVGLPTQGDRQVIVITNLYIATNIN